MRCQPLRRALCAEYWVHIHALMKNSDHPDLLAAGLLIKDYVTPWGNFLYPSRISSHDLPMSGFSAKSQKESSNCFK